MFLRFIHMLHVLINCSFLLLYNIPLYEYQNVFIHSLVDGLLGSFWFEAITNNVAISILEHIFWCTYVCILFGVCPETELLDFVCSH